MIPPNESKIGFACAYTPLSLIDAAGFAPFRVLPLTDAPDMAGSILHDNLCPHIKRILDRALANDLPELSGMVFMNSCDAMRRLADAWQKVRPHDRVILLDLPTTQDSAAILYFAGELSRLADTLAGWSGRPFGPAEIETSVRRYNSLFKKIGGLCKHHVGSRVNLQEIYNLVSSTSPEAALNRIAALPEKSETPPSDNQTVPVFLFGQILPDPQAFAFLESCGVRIADDDLCTGSRLLSSIDLSGAGTVFDKISQGLLLKPACARTLSPEIPLKIAEDILNRARACGARGVIGHTLKFCDLYLSRLPTLRQVLRDNDLPLLLLEGDCTLRSVGQQRTRVEAFTEMLR